MALYLCFLHSHDRYGHSASKCGIAWALWKRLCHRSSQLDIRLVAGFNSAICDLSGNLLSLAHKNALFSFSPGRTEVTCNTFRNWTLSSAGTWSQSSAWHWLFSCEIAEVLGTLLFAQATEAVNNSLTGLRTSISA